MCSAQVLSVDEVVTTQIGMIELIYCALLGGCTARESFSPDKLNGTCLNVSFFSRAGYEVMLVV